MNADWSPILAAPTGVRSRSINAENPTGGIGAGARNGFAARALVTSLPIVVAPTCGMNSYFPMPFRRQARITLESQHPGDLEHVFYQAGHYVGTYIALTALERFWWGEGEVKFFVDGDTEYPTLCSTGLEDYAGGAWAFQEALSADPPPTPITFSAPYFGYPYSSATDCTQASDFATPMPPSHGLYRWHLPDPIVFTERLRVTVQQIGAWNFGLFERTDDVASTAYWYQSGGITRFPPFPSVSERRPR